MDVIITAVGKFSQMGLVSQASYPSDADDTHTTWLNGEADKEEEINVIVKLLTEQN